MAGARLFSRRDREEAGVRVCLIHPYCLEARIHQDDVAAMPMGLYFVGAVLREDGHEVSLLNCHDRRDRPEDIAAALVAFRPDVVGVSVLNANRWGGIDIARMAKRLLPHAVVVFGGVAATCLWEHFLGGFPDIDYIVLGEGEYILRDLLRHLERKDEAAIASLPGLAFRDGGRPRRNPPPPPIEPLDSLPNPALYFTYSHVALTRGCPADCAFCGSPRIWGRRVRFFGADRFVEQIVLLRRRGVTFFFVSDDTFTLKKSLVVEVCRQLAERCPDIAWAAISRIDCVDEELLFWMRRAGCIQISYGVESGDPGIRDFLNKRLDPADIRRAFDLTVRHGMMARAYFIYGSPGETDETIQRTLDLMDQIRPLGAIFYLLDVFPGTALYDRFRAATGLTDAVWNQRIEDILWFEHDPALSREKVLEFGRRLRSHFYRRLPEYARSAEVADIPEMNRLAADFYSRLAMTFSDGDYARIDGIPDREATAALLHEKALARHPDARAFQGLGMLRFHSKDWDGAEDLFRRGVECHPTDVDMRIRLAVCLLNRGAISGAREALSPFRDHDAVRPYWLKCQVLLGKTGG